MEKALIVGAAIIIGTIINYRVRRAVAFVLLLGSVAFWYVALFSDVNGFTDRTMVALIGFAVLLLGIGLWRGNELWIKHETAVRTTHQELGWKAAFQKYFHIFKAEFIPGRA